MRRPEVVWRFSPSSERSRGHTAPIYPNLVRRFGAHRRTAQLDRRNRCGFALAHIERRERFVLLNFRHALPYHFERGGETRREDGGRKRGLYDILDQILVETL